MARGLTSAFNTAIQLNTVVPILLVKIDTTGGLFRVWTGYGDLTFNSEIYIGVGDLGNISNIVETRDLQANGATLTLSGIPAANISLALNQIRQGKEANIYLGLFDNSTKALIADPYELFTGETDIPIIADLGETATIGIQCENRMITLDKPRTRRYTKEDQAIDDGTDEGFNFVPALQDASVEFGSKNNPAAIAFLEAQ